MSLFDDKEEVIDLQLTQFGKRKLAEGKFSPQFYSFSDEDIIYDSQYANITVESQNNIQDRILDKTPRNKALYNFTGVDTNIKKIRRENDDDLNINENIFKDIFQSEAERTYESIISLGTSDQNSNYAPAWQIDFRKGSLSSSATVITGSENNIPIPQLNMGQVKYQVSLLTNVPREVVDELLTEGIEPGVVGDFVEFEDGSILEVEQNDIILEVDELHSYLQDDNFEIEVFEVSNMETGGSAVSGSEAQREILKPLRFLDGLNDIKQTGDIFIHENMNTFMLQDIDSNTVDYYLDVEIDEEIPVEVLCQYIPKDKRKQYFGRYFKCPEIKRFRLDGTLYDTDVLPEDVEEDC